MPDIAIFSLRFSNKFDTQQECSRDFSEGQQKVRDSLRSLKLEDAVTFSGYSCWQHHTYKKQRPKGYVYSAKGTLRLSREDQDIPAICAALTDIEEGPSLDVNFELDDRETAEDQLIEKAVTRARHNAKTLAKSAGMRICGLKAISYKSSTSTSPDESWALCLAERPSYDGNAARGVDLSPEPEEISCTVDTQWWMEAISN